MIIRLSYDVFQNILRESTPPHIFLDVKKYENGTASYTFYTSVNNMKMKTTKIVEDVEEQMMFEQSFLSGPKIIPIEAIEDSDIVLNITKG